MALVGLGKTDVGECNTFVAEESRVREPRDALLGGKSMRPAETRYGAKIRAVAMAATPSPRPVSPKPSVVVAAIETGASMALLSRDCASSRRLPSRGVFPMSWTATLLTEKPALRTSSVVALRKATPDAPDHAGSAVP